MSDKRLIRNTFILFLGNMGTKLLMFLLVPLYTKWLSPSEYGIYDTLLSILSFLSPLITLQLEQTVFRSQVEMFDNANSYFFNALKTTVIVNIFIDLCFAVTIRNITIILFLCYLNAYSISVICLEYIRGRSQLKIYASANFLVVMIVFFINIIMVGKLKLGINGLLFSYVVAYSLFLIRFFLKSNFRKVQSFDKQVFFQQLKYSIPLIPNTIGFWITNLSDKVMIIYVLGSAASGLYAVATKVPTIISVIYTSFFLAWQQEAIILCRNGNTEKFNVFLKRIIRILFSILFFILPLLKYLYAFIFDKRYYTSIYLLPILLCATIFLCLSQFLSGILFAQNDTKVIGETTVIAATINILINILFLKKGLYIAAWSTLIAYCCMFFLREWRLRKITFDKDILKELFKNLILTVFFSFSFSFNNGYIDLAFIGLSILYICFTNREYVKIYWE